MRRINWIVVGFALASAATVPAAAQDSADAVRVELTRSSEPCFLECGLVHGGIYVSAYEGDEIIVETRPRGISVSERSRERRDEDSPGGSGLRRIAVTTSSLTVEEKDNRVSVGGTPWAKGIDIHIQVPVRTSLGLSCVNDGDIHVEGVSGDVELQNVNGGITAVEVSGSVIANTTNGDVTVDLRAADEGKPMSFVTFNGELDIQLPGEVKMTMKMEVGRGEAYSDFDIAVSDRKPKMIEENTRDTDGTYRVRLEEAFFGDVNGGGPEFYFRTFNGDIYIRKGI